MVIGLVMTAAPFAPQIWGAQILRFDEILTFHKPVTLDTVFYPSRKILSDLQITMQIPRIHRLHRTACEIAGFNLKQGITRNIIIRRIQGTFHHAYSLTENKNINAPVI
nr:hypothetical protein [Thalassospira mesophila]